MRFLGIILGTIGGIAALSAALPVQAQNPLTRAERLVCKSLDQCLDILARHDALSYDYSALHQDFLRFGNKARLALLKQLNGSDETEMMRAQAILAKGGFRYSSDEQRNIAAQWPKGDLDAHKAVMQSALSPLMRARAIETLSHESARVREASRDIINATLAANMDFPMSARDFENLTQASAVYPSPALIGLLGNFDAAKARPVYIRLLRSGEGDTTAAAYDALYKIDPKTAFESLLGTLRDLETSDNDAKAAFAIAELLRRRHLTREDGFYLTFAKGIAEDPQMSDMGRMAGLDALMQWPDLSPKQAPDTAKTLGSLRLALANHKALPQNYISNFAELSFDNPNPWINAFDKSLNGQSVDLLDSRARFIAALGRFDMPQAKTLVAAALDDKADYRMAIAAGLAAHQQGQDIAAHLKGWTQTHPISQVRYTSKLILDGSDKRLKEHSALDLYKDITSPISRSAELKKINLPDQYCTVGSTDFKDLAKAMPFFKGGKIDDKPVLRNRLSSAEPLKEGWLGGYDNGGSYGGLIYYDFATKSAKTLLTQNVKTIIPSQKVPLGQHAPSHWVITGLDHRAINYGNIYRAVPSARGVDMMLHATLPSLPTAIDYQEDGSLVLGFADKDRAPLTYNPPLRLLPNGAIGLACRAGASALQKALP